MKKIYGLLGGILLSATLAAAPASVPTVSDLAAYDVTNARVIALYFDEQVCNDIVWAGSYNEWSTTPVDMMPFERLEGFDGWYVIELWDDSNPCQGKPVQLKKDGSFDWANQSGDKDAWINMLQPGTKTVSLEDGFDGEANCTWPETGAYIYEVAYFKKHNSPCGEDKPTHEYNVTLYLPEFCDALTGYEDDSVFMMGDFDWTDGAQMEHTYDEDLNDIYTLTIEATEGQEFKFRLGKTWNIQVLYNKAELSNLVFGTETDTIFKFNTEGYSFKACEPAIPADYSITVKFPDCDPNVTPSIIGEAVGSWKTATEMEYDEQADVYTISLSEAVGQYKFCDLNELWDNQLQVTADGGQTWKDMDDMTLDPENTTIELDFSGANYRWTACAEEPTGDEQIDAAASSCKKIMIGDQMFINVNGKLINMVGFGK